MAGIGLGGDGWGVALLDPVVSDGLASQFAAVAAIAAFFFFFHERLTPHQRSGFVAIAVRLAILTAVRG